VVRRLNKYCHSNDSAEGWFHQEPLFYALLLVILILCSIISIQERMQRRASVHAEEHTSIYI
jgi:hypothetical protein